MAKKLKPMHPGEVLREEFLVPLKMSAGALAKACGLPRTRIERIASEQTGITADTALRLGKALGTTAQLWLNLQNDYDVQIAKRDLGKNPRPHRDCEQTQGGLNVSGQRSGRIRTRPANSGRPEWRNALRLLRPTC